MIQYGMELLQYLREVNGASIMLRLVLAAVCGGIIGLDRGKKRRPAGFRTHVLVCVGSALAMLTNQYVVTILGIGEDTTRLGAQVISGIGFLGAGTILVTGKQQVKGLTTAAGLWASACMGLAAGIGFYEGAVSGCIFIFGGVTILHKIDENTMAKSKVADLYVELKTVKGISILLEYLKGQEIDITNMEVIKSKNAMVEHVGLFLTVKQHEKRSHAKLISMVGTVEEVAYVEET